MEKQTAQKQTSPRPVLVTTEFRGVFFGYTEEPGAPEIITLTQARNCVYWTERTKGFLGLALTGPGQGCRVGPAVPSLTLRKVTSVAEVTPEAAQAWEQAPW